MAKIPAIDKAKGIVANPMPRTWYDRASIYHDEHMTDEEKAFALSIVADRKPYFMRYVYPTLMRQYNTYISNTHRKCLREFRKPIDELLSASPEDLSPAERGFVEAFHRNLPVGADDCVMNRICRRFEEEFDGYLSKRRPTVKFDHLIMKSGAAYTTAQYQTVNAVYKAYLKQVADYIIYVRNERVSDDDYFSQRQVMVDMFRRDVLAACPDRKQLCDIIVDICYAKEGSKQFAWDIVGDDIIENLLEHNGRVINYPVVDRSGDISFHGKRYSFRQAILEKGDIDDDDRFE